MLKNISEALCGPGGCIAQEQDCYAAGDSESDNICNQADNYCVRWMFACVHVTQVELDTSIQQDNNIAIPAMNGRDPGDLRHNASAPFPPQYYANYLVVSKIGAESTYQECAGTSNNLFANAGYVCCPEVQRQMARPS